MRKRLTVQLTPEEYQFVLRGCASEGMGKSNFIRGLLNRAMRTPYFRPDKVFRESQVKLTPQERKTLADKYGIKIYRNGVK